MFSPISTFVIGGAASGKSLHAEELAMQLPGAPIYLATAQAFDDEMKDKIAAHRRRRGEDWITIEEPYDLPDAISQNGVSNTVLLVDCLTLWLSNLIFLERDISKESDALIEAVSKVKGCIVLVSNEVGLGLVPDNQVARHFRDLQGTLNQKVAAVADRVVFVAAGLPLTLKGATN